MLGSCQLWSEGKEGHSLSVCCRYVQQTCFSTLKNPLLGRVQFAEMRPTSTLTVFLKKCFINTPSLEGKGGLVISKYTYKPYNSCSNSSYPHY